MKNKEKYDGMPSREIMMAVIMRRLFDYAKNEAGEIGAVCYPPSLPKSVAIAALIEAAIRSGGVVMEGPVDAAERVDELASSQTFRLLYKSLENMGLAKIMWYSEGRKIDGIDLSPVIERAKSIPDDAVERELWLGTAVYTMICNDIYSSDKGNGREGVGPTKILSTILVADLGGNDLIIPGELFAKKKIFDFSRKVKKLTGLIVDGVGTSYFVASSLTNILVEYGLVQDAGENLRLNYKLDKEKKKLFSKCVKKFR